jgi:hypothetical protein
MKKLYYLKEGRKYIPVSEYDSDLLDSFPKGTHIVMCYPGGKSTRYGIDPAYAPMIAAGRLAEADKLMQHESVRQAYEQFLLVAKLCADKDMDGK